LRKTSAKELPVRERRLLRKVVVQEVLEGLLAEEALPAEGHCPLFSPLPVAWVFWGTESPTPLLSFSQVAWA
jgi:hypothetical protein